jgi:hypothetical protein
MKEVMTNSFQDHLPPKYFSLTTWSQLGNTRSPISSHGGNTSNWCAYTRTAFPPSDISAEDRNCNAHRNAGNVEALTD